MQLPHQPETGWRSRGERRWLWALVANSFVFLTVATTSSSAVLMHLLGTVLPGVLCSDRFGAYLKYHKGHAQFCWAHVKRDLLGIQKFARNTGVERFCRDAGGADGATVSVVAPVPRRRIGPGRVDPEIHSPAKTLLPALRTSDRGLNGYVWCRLRGDSAEGAPVEVFFHFLQLSLERRRGLFSPFEQAHRGHFAGFPRELLHRGRIPDHNFNNG